jgi:PAS domain S-box-containing protein
MPADSPSEGSSNLTVQPSRLALPLSWHLLLLLSGALLPLLVFAAFVVHRLSDTERAAAAAETMSRGGRPRVQGSTVKEVAQLNRSLAHSAALLAQHERERDEHLERADAARPEAEAVRAAQESLLEELRESEERFAKAFEASPLALTITSLKTGRLLEVNETFTLVSGYTREEAVGRTTLELGLWAEPADREAELTALARQGRLRGAEYLFRVKDGAEVTGLLSAERIEISGEPCALTVIEDITEPISLIWRSRSSPTRSSRRSRTSSAAPRHASLRRSGDAAHFQSSFDSLKGRQNPCQTPPRSSRSAACGR